MTNNIENLKLSIQCNMTRINELLSMPYIEAKEINGLYYPVCNKNNVELRQRMKLLRKETLQLEKLIERGSGI